MQMKVAAVLLLLAFMQLASGVQLRDRHAMRWSQRDGGSDRRDGLPDAMPAGGPPPLSASMQTPPQGDQSQGFPPQAPQGSQDPQGPQGSLQSPQGPQSHQDYHGLQGPQDSQGLQGPQGPQDSQGLQGPQGPQDSQGLQGLQGPQDAPGPMNTQPQGYGPGPQSSHGPMDSPMNNDNQSSQDQQFQGDHSQQSSPPDSSPIDDPMPIQPMSSLPVHDVATPALVHTAAPAPTKKKVPKHKFANIEAEVDFELHSLDDELKALGSPATVAFVAPTSKHARSMAERIARLKSRSAHFDSIALADTKDLKQTHVASNTFSAANTAHARSYMQKRLAKIQSDFEEVPSSAHASLLEIESGNEPLVEAVNQRFVAVKTQEHEDAVKALHDAEAAEVDELNAATQAANTAMQKWRAAELASQTADREQFTAQQAAARAEYEKRVQPLEDERKADLQAGNAYGAARAAHEAMLLRVAESRRERHMLAAEAARERHLLAVEHHREAALKAHTQAIENEIKARHHDDIARARRVAHAADPVKERFLMDTAPLQQRAESMTAAFDAKMKSLRAQAAAVKKAHADQMAAEKVTLDRVLALEAREKQILGQAIAEERQVEVVAGQENAHLQAVEKKADQEAQAAAKLPAGLEEAHHN